LHSRVGENWQLKNSKTGEITAISVETLLKRFETGSVKLLVGGKSPSELSKELAAAEPKGNSEAVDDEWRLALAKRDLVKSVADLGWQSVVQKAEVEARWPTLVSRLKEKPPTPDISSVHRWCGKLQQSGWDARSLLPQHFKKGRRPAPICVELFEIIEEGVSETYLTEQKKTKVDAHEAVAKLVVARNAANLHLPPLVEPSKRQVDRYIAGLEAFDVFAARHGHTAAVRRFRALHGKAIANAPLQRVELDHTLMDLIALDDETLIPLGRPTLAIALDAYTRCVLGFYIGFEPPSVSTVSQCLRSAFCPKLVLLEGIDGIENTWDSFGKMETLVVDQALENHATVWDRLSVTQSIEILYCPRKKPWFKGRIERFLQTINHGVCHKIPGTTFSNIAEKGDYDALGRAVCTVSALRAAVVKWIVDIYHVSRHRSLQMSPIGLWRRSISQDDIPLETDLATLETSIRLPIKKPLTHKGVECNNLFYNSDDLTALRKKHGAELSVLVYPSPSDLGDVVVDHAESGSRFVVPCLSQEYARGLTLWQHKAIRRFAKENDSSLATFADLLRNKAKLEAIILEGMASCPLKERVRAARQLQKTRNENIRGASDRRAANASNVSLDDDFVPLTEAMDDYDLYSASQLTQEAA